MIPDRSIDSKGLIRLGFPTFKEVIRVSPSQMRGAFSSPFHICDSYGNNNFPIVRTVWMRKFASAVAYGANGNANMRIGLMNPTFVNLGVTQSLSGLTTTAETFSVCNFVGAVPVAPWTANTVDANLWTSLRWGIALPTADMIVGDGVIELVVMGDIVPRWPI